MAIIRDPGEGGDSGHDEQRQLQPDPGQQTAHLQPVLQIHLTKRRLTLAPIRLLHFLHQFDFSAYFIHDILTFGAIHKLKATMNFCH